MVGCIGLRVESRVQDQNRVGVGQLRWNPRPGGQLFDDDGRGGSKPAFFLFDRTLRVLQSIVAGAYIDSPRATWLDRQRYPPSNKSPWGSSERIAGGVIMFGHGLSSTVASAPAEHPVPL